MSHHHPHGGHGHHHDGNGGHGDHGDGHRHGGGDGHRHGDGHGGDGHRGHGGDGQRGHGGHDDGHHRGREERHGRDGGDGRGGQPGPQNLELELSQMLGARASEMTREVFVEVLRDAIKEELRKLPELSVLVAQTAKELSEDMRLSLQIEELIAQRDKKREGRKSDLLAAMLAAGKGGGAP